MSSIKIWSTALMIGLSPILLNGCRPAGKKVTQASPPPSVQTGNATTAASNKADVSNSAGAPKSADVSNSAGAPNSADVSNTSDVSNSAGAPNSADGSNTPDVSNQKDNATIAASNTSDASNGADVSNATGKMFDSILNRYLSKLPAESPGTPASLAEQKKLVGGMIQLYNEKASSKDIHTYYLNGITQLSPVQADQFTAYAIAGMRRNSFEDYQGIEKYSNNKQFVQKFLKAAKSVQFHYVGFNLNTNNISDADVKSFVTQAKSQGYFVAYAQGMFYDLVDFSVFARYRMYNTPKMASLIETLAFDDLDPMTNDAALVVGWDTLAARTYGIEKMLADYNGTLYGKYLAVRFKDHMVMLFFGVNSSSTFDSQTQQMNGDVMALYKNIETMDGSFMAHLVKEYAAVLHANNDKMDAGTRKKGMEILNEIDTKYGITNTTEEKFGQWMSGNAVAD